MPRHNNMLKHNIFQLPNHNIQQYLLQHLNWYHKDIRQLLMDNHKQLIYHQLQHMVKQLQLMVQLQLNMVYLKQHMEQQLLNMDQQPLHMEQHHMDKLQLLMVQLKHIKQVDGNKFIQQQLEMYLLQQDKEYHKQDQDKVHQLVSICDWNI